MKITPIALTIAGSDSGGGAGVQADIKAISANGVYAASVITAITAQNTQTVVAVHPVPADIVTAQIAAVLSDLNVGAIKLGVLFSAPIISVVAAGLAGYHGPVVVDPVMIAKSGDTLLQGDAVDALIRLILPHAALLTPNLPEAAQLLEERPALTQDEVIGQGLRLLHMGPRAVLMKGGHSQGPACTDFLIEADGTVTTLTAPRSKTRNTHGTGCTYSAAIAAQLAKGQTMLAAVRAAHTYLQGAIQAADTLHIGAGHGPVHHFHEVW